MSGLPIAAAVPAVRCHLSEQNNLVLQAPPGAGKTTQVPLALLNEPWLKDRRILILEPRRLAARAAAAHMAALLNEPLGKTVGYRIRFERKVSAHTRIEVLTEGILTRQLQNDPGLENVGLVIFDEFHERSLHADLALALCLESQAVLRDDMRLLVMSATLDGEALAKLLGDAPIVSSAGRSHAIGIHYLERDLKRDWRTLNSALVNAIVQALHQQQGDVLVFLPGAREIRQTISSLGATPACRGIKLLPLYGDLPFAEQQRALKPDPEKKRKIVLATAIAETSLTIEGIGAVVDSGLSRVPRFAPRSGLTRLETQRISADSAEQRAGRAGRLGPGVCYRLWSESTQKRLQPNRRAEILDADLSAPVLELAQWGARKISALPWLNPPPPGALAQARSLLLSLGALDEQNRITALGRRMLTWPLHPRLARMLCLAEDLGLGELACDIAALLDDRDIVRSNRQYSSDLALRVDMLQQFRLRKRDKTSVLEADPAACARVDRAAKQWRGRLQSPAATANKPAVQSAGLLLAFAYPDRIACRRENSCHRYLLVSGRGAKLHDDDALAGTDWLVAAHMDAGANEGRIFLAAAIAKDDIAIHLRDAIVAESVIKWDVRRQTVIMHERTRLGRAILDKKPLERPDAGQISLAMLDGIRQQLGLGALPWNDATRQWQARVLSLRQWFPEQDWPDVTDQHLLATLTQWLAPYLGGITRREHLQRLDLHPILQTQLNWRQQKRLDELAPTHLQVPSGSRLRLHYTAGQPPVLAVKLQEMFGLAETPAIAGGRIRLMLHLLSPARRPVQVTQDLKGFWENTYHEVKKELKGRYPKHPWPDDPWRATPTRHSKRRF